MNQKSFVSLGESLKGEQLEQMIFDIRDLCVNDEGGREAYSFSEDEDRLFDYVQNYFEVLESERISFEVDAIGNLYVFVDREKGNIVSCGSHLDSVVNGGSYDGVAGVVAGMEALRVIIENQIQKDHGFCLMVFRAEESSVTGMACIGSGIATGVVSSDKIADLDYRAEGSIQLKEFLVDRGYAWEEIEALSRDPFVTPGLFKSYVELHIEQGKVLEQAGLDVGVVEKGIGGAVRWEIKKALEPLEYELKANEWIMNLSYQGMRDHSGGTPMNGIRGEVYRDDALVKSAKALPEGRMIDWDVSQRAYNVIPGEVTQKMVVEAPHAPEDKAEDVVEVWDEQSVEAISDLVLWVEEKGEYYAEESDGGVCATIGGVRREGDEVVIYCDVRVLDEKAAYDFLQKFSEFLEDRGFTYEERSHSLPAFFDDTVVDELADSYEMMGEGHAFYLPSMPGHDARNVCKAGIPTGMIFLACRRGVSHSPEEYSSPEALQKGARLLLFNFLK